MAVQIPISFELHGNQGFADFYAGSNQEIVSHLSLAASGNGEHFIVLWGESGFGKTHLLNACCEQATNENFYAFYLDCTSVKTFSHDSFDGLENYHLICLDNIQHLSGNQTMEIALFNLFNRIREQEDSRLIVSLNQPPKAIAFILPDLQTRLNSGLTLKINPLTDPDKIAALKLKANRLGLELDEKTSQFLLTHYDRNLASLWQMLDKLDKASLAEQRKLTVPFVKSVLNLK